MGEVKWYHVAALAAAWYLWQKREEELALLGAQVATAQAGQRDAESSAAADVAAEHRAALAARAEIAKRDAALAAQAEITTQTVGAIAGSTVRAVLPPSTNAPPRVVSTAPAAVGGEKTLALTANVGDTRIVPREGSLSIVRDNTYGGTPTVRTEQLAMAVPSAPRSSSQSVPDDLQDARNTR